MQVRVVAAGVLVLVGLLVGVQLAVTTVGQTTGPSWSEPTQLATLPADEETEMLDVASASGDPGAVAWLVRDGDTWRITVARVAIGDSAERSSARSRSQSGDGEARSASGSGTESGNAEVTVTEQWTAVESDEALAGLDVAVRGRTVAVVWERAGTNDVTLAERTPDGNRTTVVSGDSPRVAEPSVAFAGSVPVVAWQAFDDGRFVVGVATVDDEVRRHTLDAPVRGTNSPTVVATDEQVGIVWADAEDGTARVTTGTVGPGASSQFEGAATLGDARPRTGIGSGPGRALTVGGGRNETTVRAVWTDVAAVETATVRDGSVVERRRIGSGERPDVAVHGDRWLAAWLVDTTGSGIDVRYHYGGPAASSGTLSRLPSSARAPRPLFAPDPGVAWLERGGQWRVLAAAHLDEPRGGSVERLGEAPLRFLFVAVAAALVGLLTVPVFPWVLFGFVAAFLVTTGAVRDRALGALAVLARPVASTSPNELRARLAAVPALVWLVPFALVETALLVAFLGTGAVPGTLAFRAPVAISVAALVGTVLLVAPRRQPSGWLGAFLFVYLQSAALWATVIPSFT